MDTVECKERRNTVRKKYFRYFVVIFVLLFLIGSCGSVLAYLTSSDSAGNSFKVGACNTQIEEKYKPPDEIDPGCSFTKDVKITNTGPSDCYVRVKAVFSDEDMGKYCKVDWNTIDFDYDSDDGYYYYRNKLKADETTESLFTSITVDENIPADEIKPFDILVYSEACEASDIAGYREIWQKF